MQTQIGRSLDRPGHCRQRVLLILVAWARRGTSATRSRRSPVIASNVASVHAAQELEISLREIHVQFDRYLITVDRKHLESVPRLQQPHGGGARRGRVRGPHPAGAGADAARPAGLRALLRRVRQAPREPADAGSLRQGPRP